MSISSHLKLSTLDVTQYIPELLLLLLIIFYYLPFGLGHVHCWRVPLIELYFQTCSEGVVCVLSVYISNRPEKRTDFISRWETMVSCHGGARLCHYWSLTISASLVLSQGVLLRHWQFVTLNSNPCKETVLNFRNPDCLLVFTALVYSENAKTHFFYAVNWKLDSVFAVWNCTNDAHFKCSKPAATVCSRQPHCALNLCFFKTGTALLEKVLDLRNVKTV